MIELRCRRMQLLEIVFITMCDRKMPRVLIRWIIMRRLFIRYFKRQMIWGARLENLDRKYFRRIQVFRQTQWVMLSWMWFSKRWKRKGLSKMLSDDFNQIVKRFSCWQKLLQTLSSQVVRVSDVQMHKVLKWSTNSWSVFSSTFVANNTSPLTIYRFSWNKMVSNKSPPVKVNQFKI